MMKTQRNRNGIPIVNAPDFPCAKDVYASRDAANAIALIRGARLQQYRCPRCAGWHNTKGRSKFR